MEYPGPEPADFTQVYALNRAFLDYALTARQRLVAELEPATRDRLFAGGREIRRRLARCPFLLFSVGEDDESLWEPFFGSEPQRDLLEDSGRPGGAELQLTCAALGLMWQLAKRNAYAARVLSGASVAWCERIADAALMDLFRYAGARRRLLRFRYATNAAFWNQLIRAAESDAQNVRAAARITALQLLLTGSDFASYVRLRTAACATGVPRARVSARSAVSQSRTRGYNTSLNESPLDKKSKQDLRKR